jgi:ribonuclease-3
VVVREEGPDHEKEFTVDVLIADRSYGTGMGRNKKDAEQNAAEEALRLFTRRPRARRRRESDTRDQSADHTQEA